MFTNTVIDIGFSTKNFTLLPTDYLRGRASGNPNMCLTWPMAYPPSSDGIDWQFGSAFLRTVYSIFRYSFICRVLFAFNCGIVLELTRKNRP